MPRALFVLIGRPNTSFFSFFKRSRSISRKWYSSRAPETSWMIAQRLSLVPATQPKQKHSKSQCRFIHTTTTQVSSAPLRVEIETGKMLLLFDPAHTDKHHKFHSVWLRHNCQCSSCVSSSGQKVILPEALDPNTSLLSAKVNDEVVQLSWSCGHTGHIAVDWLARNYYPSSISRREDTTKPLTATVLPQLHAAELTDDIGLWKWLKYLNEYGACLLTDLTPQVGEILKVAKKLYNVQPTIYGENFAVVSEESPVNIAYSSMELGYHMDLAYYESPPGLQLLHCIRYDSCVEGGESDLLDSFPVVEELRVRYPEHFETLTRVPATFQKVHYDRAEPVEMKYQRPHVVVDGTGKITAIHWSPPFEGPLHVPKEDVEPYYEAYHVLANMFKTSDLKLVHRLQVGDVLTFNNRRILHSRKVFKLNGGMRHLEGVYVNIDEFKSKFQVLCTKLGKIYPVKRVFNHNST